MSDDNPRDDYWIGSVHSIETNVNDVRLDVERVDKFAPLRGRKDTEEYDQELSILDHIVFPQPQGTRQTMTPELSLPKQTSLQTYAILDAAKITGLSELLDVSGLEHRCLFKDGPNEELQDLAPWLVRLEQGNAFTNNLFSLGDAPWHLWRRHAGIYIRATTAFEALWKHYRRFSYHYDEQHAARFLRYYDPAVAYTVMDYIQTRPEEIALWFKPMDGSTIQEVLTTRRKPNDLYSYKLTGDTTLLKPCSVKSWGAEFGPFAREETELRSSLKLLEQLRASTPEAWLPQDNKTLLFYVREARKAARQYGISHPEHLTKFVYLGVICAPFFWEEPKAKAFLAKNNEDPNARFSDFYSLFEREARNAPVQWVLPNGGL